VNGDDIVIGMHNEVVILTKQQVRGLGSTDVAQR
jgi:hypothetical protein